ncbi:MAG: LysE family translocator [Methyloligellaceae bacterium]
MTFAVFAVFVLACAVLALTPGPSMALLLANTTRYGGGAGLFTWSGNMTGLCLLVVIAILGMNSIMIFMSEWFDWLRWIGAVYLIWLGANAIYSAIKGHNEELLAKRGKHYFRQGLFVSLSNPKVLLFLGAFFPQFINQNNNITSQLVLLAMTFIIVMGLIDFTCVIIASRLTSLMSDSKRRFADGISGSLLILGGLWLATARKS